MVNTIATQTLQDGPRNLVVKVNILGDASGEETATQLIDVSAYDGHGKNWDEVSILRAQGSLTGFSVNLLWDATTDLRAMDLSADDPFCLDHREVGGLINDAGTGVTGDINFTTVGLGAADTGSFVLWMKKRSG